MTLAPAPDLGLLDEADAGATLRALESTVRARRRAETDDLLLCLHWADLHASDPRGDPGAQWSRRGGDHLTEVGGQGTPWVRELSLCELAVARSVHVLSARAALADALDLRHRLPRTWQHVLSLEAEPWVARKVAAISRHLPEAVIDVVDAKVAAAITGQAPSRVDDIARAAIIEADPWLHQQRVEAERSRRFVTLGRSGETGLRDLVARLTVGDATWVDATVARVAEILHSHPDHPELHDAAPDVRRSAALGWLGRPAELLALLTTHSDDEIAPGEARQNRAIAVPEDVLDRLTAAGLMRLRPAAVLYVHLHEASLTRRTTSDGEQLWYGAARVEGGPPIALDQLAELLAYTDLRVTPVVDLAESVSVNAYEFPAALRDQIHLAQPSDAFPHASRTTRTVDVDHVTAWSEPDQPSDGDGGRTSTDNAQPLSRTPHRAKTHLGYTVTDLPREGPGPPARHWRTPHGLTRIVDHTGTHRPS